MVAMSTLGRYLPGCAISAAAGLIGIGVGIYAQRRINAQIARMTEQAGQILDKVKLVFANLMLTCAQFASSSNLLATASNVFMQFMCNLGIVNSTVIAASCTVHLIAILSWRFGGSSDVKANQQTSALTAHAEASVQNHWADLLTIIYEGVATLLGFCSGSIPSRFRDQAHKIFTSFSSVASKTGGIFLIISKLISLVSRIFGWACNYKSKRDLLSEITTQNPEVLRTWLTLANECLHPDFQVEVKYSKDKFMKLDVVYRIGRELIKNAPIGAQRLNSFAILKDYMSKIDILYERALAWNSAGVQRKEPFCIWMTGEPGVGKSQCASSIIDRLLMSSEIYSVGPSTYTVQPGTKYWTECDRQPAVLFDDFFASGTDDMIAEDVAAFMRLKSCAVFCPEQAELSNKGKPYAPRLILVLSNMVKPSLNCIRGGGAAFDRRRDVILHARLHPWFAQNNCTKISDAAGEEKLKQFRDIHCVGLDPDTEEYHFAHVQLGFMTSSDRTAREYISYVDMLSILDIRFKAFNEKQESLVKFRVKQMRRYQRACAAPIESGVELLTNVEEMSTAIDCALRCKRTPSEALVETLSKFKRALMGAAGAAVSGICNAIPKLWQDYSGTQEAPDVQAQAESDEDDDESIEVIPEDSGEPEERPVYPGYVNANGDIILAHVFRNMEQDDLQYVDIVQDEIPTEEIPRPPPPQGPNIEGIHIDAELYQRLRSNTRRFTVINVVPGSIDYVGRYCYIYESNEYFRVSGRDHNVNYAILRAHNILPPNEHTQARMFQHDTNIVIEGDQRQFFATGVLFLVARVLCGAGIGVLLAWLLVKFLKKAWHGVSGLRNYLGTAGNDATRDGQAKYTSQDASKYTKINKVKASISSKKLNAHATYSDNIVPLMLRNICYLDVVTVNKLNGTKSSNVFRCFGICDTYVLALKHYFTFLDDDSSIKVAVYTPHGITYKTCVWSSIKQSSYECSEYVLLQLPNDFPKFRDIRCHFVNAESIDQDKLAKEISIVDIDRKSMVITNHHKELHLCGEQHIKYEGIVTSVIPAAYAYRWGKPGDCGTLAIGKYLGRTYIISMHVAGSPGWGFGEPILAPMFSHLGAIPDLPPVCAEGIAVVDAQSAPAHIELVGTYEYVGQTTKPHRMPTKTQILPSLLHGYIAEPVTAPAFLTFNKLKEGIQHHVNPIKPFKPEYVDKAVQDYSDLIMLNCKPVRTIIGVLSREDAVLGFPGLDGYRAMNLSTSEGFPFVNYRPKGQSNKRWLIQADHDERKVEFHEMLISALNYHEQFAAAGTVSETVFIDCLKDARIPVEKLTKDSSTRVFSVSPTDYTVLFRQYFMDYLASYKVHRLDLEHGIGISTFGSEWHVLLNKITRQGTFTKFLCGDYSKFGPRLEQHIVREIGLKVILRWYEKYETDYTDREDHEIAQSVRRVLLEEQCNAIHLAHDFLYKVFCGLPSGAPATAPFNSKVNSVYIRIAWLACFKDDPLLSSFAYMRANISIMTYGDDLVIGVSDEVIDRFNNIFLHDFFKEHDLKYTDASKNEEMAPYVEISDISFLKHKFFPHPSRGLTIAQINVSSIYECINWIRKSNDDKYATYENCEAALLLSYGHGPHFYNDLRLKLINVWSELGGIPCSTYRFYTWEELDSIIFSVSKEEVDLMRYSKMVNSVMTAQHELLSEMFEEF